MSAEITPATLNPSLEAFIGGNEHKAAQMERYSLVLRNALAAARIALPAAYEEAATYLAQAGGLNGEAPLVSQGFYALNGVEDSRPAGYVPGNLNRLVKNAVDLHARTLQLETGAHFRAVHGGFDYDNGIDTTTHTNAMDTIADAWRTHTGPDPRAHTVLPPDALAIRDLLDADPTGQAFERANSTLTNPDGRRYSPRGRAMVHEYYQSTMRRTDQA